MVVRGVAVCVRRVSGNYRQAADAIQRNRCIAGFGAVIREAYMPVRDRNLRLAVPGEIAMRTEQQIDAAAAAAAEKANGGKFTDPLFYKPEHRAFWKDVIRTALDAADAASASTKAPLTPVSKEEVQKFSEHCVYIRSVWVLMMRIWRDSDENERKLMEGIAPLFFAPRAFPPYQPSSKNAWTAGRAGTVALLNRGRFRGPGASFLRGRAARRQEARADRGGSGAGMYLGDTARYSVTVRCGPHSTKSRELQNAASALANISCGSNHDYPIKNPMSASTGCG
jgi:hypothetical protein